MNKVCIFGWALAVILWTACLGLALTHLNLLNKVLDMQEKLDKTVPAEWWYTERELNCNLQDSLFEAREEIEYLKSKKSN